MSKTLNEETVKSRILVPYLTRCGFDLSELSFEDSFTVRVGRKRARPSTMTGRLDILVKRGDEHLFLVEAKREGEELTPDDRDQGISYARLLHPIAPYVLVTNGTDFKLFDTLSKQEVHGTTVSPDSRFSVALPSDLVEEAISHFLGLSEENLATFCRSQVEEEIRPLLGSKEQPNKKFIPELYVQRHGLSEAVARFLAGPKVLLALVGDSGAGKTCDICALAQKLLEQQPVLFFRGINLDEPILGRVASDFGWTFSEDLAPSHLLRRLERIASERPLVLAIDGIDEWEYPRRRQDLLATARKLASLGNVRLVVTCKTTTWEQFTSSRGQPTGIEEYLFEGSPGTKGVAVSPLGQREFSLALDRYRAFYGVGRAWEDAALEAARRSPFFMRVAFEVAQERGGDFIVLNTVDFFEKYFNQTLARLEHRDAARLILTSLAGMLLDSGTERVGETELLVRLGPTYSPDAMRELLDFQILERTFSGRHVSFYFSLLRDYIAAFHSKRWQDISDEAFSREMSGANERVVTQEALAFFYRYASPAKQRLMDAEARSRAELILTTYSSILETDLQPIRDRFVPFTKAPIGYVGTFEPGSARLGFSEFRKLGAGDEAVLLLPAVGRRLFDSNLPQFHRARAIIGVPALEDSDPVDWTINRAIGHQLREIVKDGRLRESSELEMLKESLSGIVSRWSCGYAGEPHPSRLRQRSPKYPRQIPDLFPLRLEEVWRWLRYGLLHNHFRSIRLREKVESGETETVEEEEGILSYSGDLTWEDLRHLDERILTFMSLEYSEVERLFGASTVSSTLRDVFARATEALEGLSAAGIEVLEDELFPEPEILNRTGLKLEELCAFLERLYARALAAYAPLVRSNFPTLHQHFPTVKWHPLTVVLAVTVKRERGSSGYVTAYVCEGSAPSPRVIARPAKEVKTVILRDVPWRFEVEIEGQRFLRREEVGSHGALSQRHMGLERVLYPGNQYFGGLHGLSSAAGQRICSPLRTVVYDWVRMELAFAFAELCARYGTEVDSSQWTFFPRPQ